MMERIIIGLVVLVVGTIALAVLFPDAEKIARKPSPPQLAPTTVRPLEPPDPPLSKEEQARRRALTDQVAREAEAVQRRHRRKYIRMSFAQCLSAIRSLTTDLGVAPVIVSDSPILREVQFPLVDGAMFITCDSRENEMFIAIACNTEAKC